MYIAIYYGQKMVAKCLNGSLLSWGTLCLVIIIYIYIYNVIYIKYIYIYNSKYIYIYICMNYIYLYLNLHIYVRMSVCVHLSLCPTFWMDAAGFEPAGGGGYRLEMKNHLQPGVPEASSTWKSFELYPVSRQYIAKANRTSASKLAFVIRSGRVVWFVVDITMNYAWP